MAEHRIALRDNADLAKAGASGNTAGIVAVRNALPTRGAQPNVVQISTDGVGGSVFSLHDGLWGTKTLVDTILPLFTIALPVGTACGGTIQYLIEAASAAPEYQALAGTVTYSGVNKAGTTSGAITSLTTTDAKTATSGTIVPVWTIVGGVQNFLTVNITATGSLTETTFRITYFVSPIQGVVTIVP